MDLNITINNSSKFSNNSNNHNNNRVVLVLPRLEITNNNIKHLMFLLNNYSLNSREEVRFINKARILSIIIIIHIINEIRYKSKKKITKNDCKNTFIKIQF
jgi:hypothetical protein